MRRSSQSWISASSQPPRRIAILVAEGAESQSLETLAKALLAAGAVPRFVGARLGEVTMTGSASAEGGVK
jgi:catalase